MMMMMIGQMIACSVCILIWLHCVGKNFCPIGQSIPPCTVCELLEGAKVGKISDDWENMERGSAHELHGGCEQGQLPLAAKKRAKSQTVVLSEGSNHLSQWTGRSQSCKS
jgi:hypothetical protein